MIQGNHIIAPINIADPYNLMGVGKLGDFYDLAYICGNTHGKINIYAKYKPYKINTPKEITDSDRLSANYGMAPKSVGLNNINEETDLLWGQWSAPVKDVDWSRLNDFIGYNHSAISCIDKIEMGNSLTGSIIPVKKSTVYENNTPFGYNATLYFNINAELSIGDYWINTVSNLIKTYRLTLVIGADIDGLDSGNIVYAQSEKTVEEGLSSGLMTVYLPTDTDEFYDLMNVNINKNIVFLCLAPTASNNSLSTVVSLKMYEYVDNFIHQNSKCASYGDGAEGGEIPAFTSYGHMDLKTTDLDSAFDIYKDAPSNSIIIGFAKGYPTFSITSGNVGNGFDLDLQLDINARLADGGSAGQFSITSPFTEKIRFSKNNETQTFVEGSPESGILGVKIDKSWFSQSGLYNFEIRVVTRTIAVSSGQRISVQSDGQGNGIQTEFFTKQFNVSF